MDGPVTAPLSPERSVPLVSRSRARLGHYPHDRRNSDWARSSGDKAFAIEEGKADIQGLYLAIKLHEQGDLAARLDADVGAAG